MIHVILAALAGAIAALLATKARVRARRLSAQQELRDALSERAERRKDDAAAAVRRAQREALSEVTRGDISLSDRLRDLGPRN